MPSQHIMRMIGRLEILDDEAEKIVSGYPSPVRNRVLWTKWGYFFTGTMPRGNAKRRQDSKEHSLSQGYNSRYKRVFLALKNEICEKPLF